jgi:EmrB/QacA subfamily drug resistance transporter
MTGHWKELEALAMEAITPAVPASRPASRSVNPTAVLAVVALAQFMVILDSTVVNVALPTLRIDLGFSEQNLSWVLNAYTLMFGGFLLLGGRAADRLGRRRLFVAGIALFSSASLICGLSQSEGMLLAARAAQGLGGAMVSPAALSIILTTFAEGAERNRALGIWGAIAGAGGAIGVLLGGVIVQAISWRWVFFINVPIGVAVLAVTPRIVPESRSPAAANRGYDAGGAITITLGLIALVFTLIKTGSWGWGSGKTIAGFVIAAMLIAAFIAIEKRHPDPLVPLRIFSNRSLASSDVTMLLVAAGLFGMFYFCTLYLQQVLGYSALKTGLSYLPFSLTLVAASTGASRLVDRFEPKPVLVTGLLISTVGFVLMTQVSGHSDYGSHVLPAFVILAVGLGLSFVPITISATTGVAAGDSGLASGLLNTTQQIGGSLGLAILSTISSTRINDALHAGAGLPAALTHGFKGAFTAGAILCAAAAVFALVLLPRRKRVAENGEVEVVALSFARCPGAPYCGALARIAGWGRRIRGRPASQN